MSYVWQQRTHEGRIVDQIIGEEYFAEAVRADGPWEARFIFCGTYGFAPDKVAVAPKFRVRGGEYWCSVGDFLHGKERPRCIHMSTAAMSKFLDHLKRALP